MKYDKNFKSIQSKIKRSFYLLLLFGSIGSIILSWYLLRIEFRSDDRSLYVIPSLFFGLLGCITLTSLFWSINKLTIANNEIGVSSLFKKRKTIHLTDIVYYTEINKENKYLK